MHQIHGVLQVGMLAVKGVQPAPHGAILRIEFVGEGFSGIDRAPEILHPVLVIQLTGDEQVLQIGNIFVFHQQDGVDHA